MTETGDLGDVSKYLKRTETLGRTYKGGWLGPAEGEGKDQN
jgi:hypothetical protein